MWNRGIKKLISEVVIPRLNFLPVIILQFCYKVSALNWYQYFIFTQYIYVEQMDRICRTFVYDLVGIVTYYFLQICNIFVTLDWCHYFVSAQYL